MTKDFRKILDIFPVLLTPLYRSLFAATILKVARFIETCGLDKLAQYTALVFAKLNKQLVLAK
ncbi:hypothetical protein DP113_15505 [Brasilonema octagenarum UFV-E1]|uniref:Uncharacterized protein n=2 Tax=Brasilonema TaxID=383614 RepID=A0A856MG48_9CYAN|nr:hypothetical protein [Brasilonema octagenarum UFV-OR1]QDL09129.1 hypothetical protein DP114_15570 [Brasilonema sennae CENA114]QDL15486.1 hypothetical protein DP113_15505 [Brasilonema octagenarum UFV-E1]